MEIEREALRKETDDASKARLETLEKELAEIGEEAGAMKQRWEAEKSAISALRATKSEQEQLQVRVDQAEREADYGRAAELKYGKARELAERLTEQEAAIAALQGPGSLLKEEVTADDIAEIVAAWTGIPVTRLMEGELQKLVHMEERLHEASSASRRPSRRCRRRRRRAGLRPAAAHRLVPVPRSDGRSARPSSPCPGAFMFDDEQAMVRIDMSEYMEKFAVSRLVGRLRLRRLRRGRPADRGRPAAPRR